MPSLFKTVGAVLCLVFALCFAAPNANADSITDVTINFTVKSGSLTPTGSFLFDNTTSAFTSFTVDFDGLAFDLTTLANALSALTLQGCASPGFLAYLEANGCGASPSWIAGTSGTSGTIEGFFFSDTATDFGENVAIPGGAPTVGAIGTFTTGPSNVPEPSSLALMLSGVGLVFGMRKRWTSGLQLDR
jgi:hypothetical protein